jgi:hypothetical protein
MCSNCSGDDLRPETFASFDVSSPERELAFAAGLDSKRKRYGTSRVWTAIINSPLTLAILRMRQWATSSRIIGKVDRGRFVNLNLGSSYGEAGTNTGSSAGVEGLIEIRVSADSIIEVYSGWRTAQHLDDKNGSREREHGSAWEESFAERSELRRTLNGFRRARRLKYFLAYSAFATAAAVAVWCAVR